MADIALVPQCDILKRHNRISPNYASQTAQSFAGNWVSLVRHRRAAFLSLPEKFFHFENFWSLQMAKLGCPTIDARSDHGQRSHEFCMPIALHDLGRECGRLQTKLFADRTLDRRIDMRMRADSTTDFSHTNPLANLSQTFFRAAKFVEHEREFQTESDWFRMNTMTPPDHGRHLVATRLDGDCRSYLFHIIK